MNSAPPLRFTSPSSNYVHVLNPRSYVTLFEKRVFVDVLKWRISSWDPPGFSRYTLNSRPQVLWRDREERKQTEGKVTRRQNQRLERCSHKPRKLGATRRWEVQGRSFSTPFRESFVLLAPVLQTVKEDVWYFKSPSFWYFGSKTRGN